MKNVIFSVLVLVLSAIAGIGFYFESIKESNLQENIIAKEEWEMSRPKYEYEAPAPPPLPYKIIISEGNPEKMYVSFDGKKRGPFTKIDEGRDDISEAEEGLDSKLFSWDRWSGGFSGAYTFFDSLLIGNRNAYSKQRMVGESVSVVMNAAGDSAVALSGQPMLPFTKYDYLQVAEYWIPGGPQVSIDFFSRGYFGNVIINMDKSYRHTQIFVSYNSNLRDKKAKICSDFDSGTALVKSRSGFGLIDLRGEFTVSPRYRRYEKISTTHYLFTATDGSAVIADREGSNY